MNLYYDPPELKQQAARGDPPPETWPGTYVTREDIMAASGDKRDWFKYHHRLDAAERAWAEHFDSRSRRRDLSAGFDWDQILIIGEYGSGKTTLGIMIARYYFGLGHCVFSNASCLFGWRFRTLNEMYTALIKMPNDGVLLIDESSSALSSAMAPHVAVRTFMESNLNSRKRNCKVIYMTAQDRNLARDARADCRRVLWPVNKNAINVKGRRETLAARTRGYNPAADNIENFRLAYYEWDDYPFKMANLIEGGSVGRKGEGFGPPNWTRFIEGRQVRDAMLLNDTFQLAIPGGARVANEDGTIREDLSNLNWGDSSGPPITGRQKMLAKVIEYLWSKAGSPPSHFTPAELGVAAGVDPSFAGSLLHELAPTILNVPGKGYPADEVYWALERLEAQQEA